MIRHVERHGARRPWLVQLMARRTTKVAAVALANKNARMIWAIMTSGEATESRSCALHSNQAPLRRTTFGKGDEGVM